MYLSVGVYLRTLITKSFFKKWVRKGESKIKEWWHRETEIKKVGENKICPTNHPNSSLDFKISSG